MTNLEKITAKVIEAVPDIEFEGDICISKVPHPEKCEHEKMYRDITLADVLNAMSKDNPGTITLAFNGKGSMHFDSIHISDPITWNLSLDLEENIKENPALGEFLVKVLCQ